MKELINIYTPQFMKHFSVGSSIGIALAFALSLIMSDTLIIVGAVFFTVVGFFGFKEIKDDFINHINK
jgi:uncharacterized BrkB/YihY/UPF0761 family membrane protein